MKRSPSAWQLGVFVVLTALVGGGWLQLSQGEIEQLTEVGLLGATSVTGEGAGSKQTNLTNRLDSTGSSRPVVELTSGGDRDSEGDQNSGDGADSTGNFSAEGDSTACEMATVKRAIDGDTVELEDGRRVRYIGIDTPETVDPRREVECFGKQASEKNKALVTDQEVCLEKDVSETDRYGRLLRYIFVGELFLNEYLVREGYAQASAYPPDVKYQDLFTSAQNEAQAAKRGLWGSLCAN